MKAAWYEQNGSASEVLRVGTLADPVPSAGEVCIKVFASGVNPSDVKSRAGRPLIAPRITPHSDGAGVIVSVGAGVADTRIGERVWIWWSMETFWRYGGGIHDSTHRTSGHVAKEHDV